MPTAFGGEPATTAEPASRREYRRMIGLACACGVLALALAGLVGGLTGQRFLDSPLLRYVPMAPSTALLFLLLGGLLLQRTSGPRRLSALAGATLLLVAAAVFLNLAESLLGLNVGILDSFFRRLNAWAGVPHVDMSPATAGLFTLAVAASWPLSGRRGQAPAPGLKAAGVLAACIVLGGGVFLLGYAFGSPLLYSSAVVPVAKSTALAFLLLGAALVCEAGPEVQPLRMFHGPSPRAVLLRAFVPLALALSLAHSLLLGPGGPHLGEGNALFAAGMAVAHAGAAGLVVALVVRRVGGAMEQAETLRSRAEALIRLALKEKTVMLKELHHRVKNNMQIVSSLLQLQSDYVADPDDRLLFEESQRRIKSMSLVHEELYKSEDLSFVDMGQYVPRLVGQLVGGAVPEIRTDFEVGNVRMSITQSVPCGLLLNELVMNAMKHAFRQSAAPRLSVALRVEGQSVELAVKDNGPGLPPGFSPAGGGTFGMILAASLAEQLRGQLSAESTGRGASFVLRFPLEPLEPGATAA